MADFEERLRELEETLTDTESVLQRQKAPMPNENTDTVDRGEGACIPYMYIIGALIPLISVLALYFAKPKFVTKKVKGKQVVCMIRLAGFTAAITVVGWVAMYFVNRYTAFGDAVLCLGKCSA